MLKRFRLWQLRLFYREIARLERHVDSTQALILRGEFAVETFQDMENEQIAAGWSRGQRREYKRRILGHV